MGVNVFGVVGAGQMGNGIAHVAAASGLEVIMNDVKQEFVDKGLKTIEKNLDRAILKGKMTADEKSTILGRIKPSVDLKDLKGADFVVEAIIENLDLKKQVFQTLDEVVAPGKILASNTSSISITKLAACVK
ncbi:MAG: 3-hydroxyacyl-CoA dehydrogenase NAD-binding domain-containing protein, partial [Deltaproteobacteria bacterium]|nr:3-hydroxyacyl-CoA dehydrogenase NAD-binding domain-containing protein [Deltaproteobacteria bacterium]